MNRDIILEYLRRHKNEFVQRYGIEKIALFGSFAWGEAREDSDIDIFVKMNPDLFKMVELKEQIEQDLQKKVDIIREHKHIKPLLLKMIQKDLIYV